MASKQNIGLKGIVISACVGLLVATVFSLALLSLEGILVLKKVLTPGVTEIVAVIVHGVTMYLGCVIAGGMNRNAATYTAIGVLAGSLLLHVAFSILFLDQGFGHVLGVVIPELAGFGLAVLTLAGKGRDRKTQKVMKRYL